MIKLSLGQHVFGNFEKGLYAPKSGFQTLFYTKEVLSEGMSDEIERFLVYMRSESKPEKRLFFKLREDKFVISRIISIEETDKFGRVGKYLAHSLIISRRDFEKIFCNPFIIFKSLSGQFVNTNQEAIEKGNPNNGNIEKIDLEISEDELFLLEEEMSSGISAWSKDELKKLAICAYYPDLMARGKRTLAINGRQEEIEQVLKCLFALVPSFQRQSLSFDTYFHGCNLINRYLWAAGFSSPSEIDPNLFFLIDANGKKIFCPDDFQPEMFEPYTKWLFEILDNEDGVHLSLARDKFWIIDLENLLSGFSSYNKRNLLRLSSKSIENFLEINLDMLKERVKKSPSRAISQRLELMVYKDLLKMDLNTEDLVGILEKGVDLNRAAEILYEDLTQDLQGKLWDEDIKQGLERLLIIVRHTGLKVLLDLAEGKSLDLLWDLERLSPIDYKAIIRKILEVGLVSPEKLVSPLRIDLLISEINCIKDYRNIRDSILKIVKTLVYQGQAEHILNIDLSSMTINEIEPIEHIIRTSPYVSKGEKEKIEESLQKEIKQKMIELDIEKQLEEAFLFSKEEKENMEETKIKEKKNLGILSKIKNKIKWIP